ncbi:MAG: GNAT family N-acetyltransferase [Pseudomonadota bacterium]
MQTTEADLDRVERIEQSMLATWPAPYVHRDGSWNIRRAKSFTGRVNSVTILDPQDDQNADERVSNAETIFLSEDVRPCFRVTPLMPPMVTELLKERGYVEFDPTHILFGKVPVGEAETHRIEDASKPTLQWIETVETAAPRSDANRAMLQAVLEGLSDLSCGFLLAFDGERPIGAALAVLHNNMVTFHSVAVHAEYRRRGVGSALMQAGFRFAIKHGVTKTWIAVAGANTPAVALYRGLGLNRIYGYSYLGAPA